MATEKASKLPPGIVLGPDGKPCKACSEGASFRAFAAAHRKPITTSSKPVPIVSPQREEPPTDCPPDVNRLGRHTWTLLHSTAAYYPSSPTVEHQRAMRTFISALPLLYPCSHCASDLSEDLRKSPPDVSGREALSRWMCLLHNGVNRKLGKEEFDCERVDERWRDGWSDGRCD